MIKKIIFDFDFPIYSVDWDNFILKLASFIDIYSLKNFRRIFLRENYYFFLINKIDFSEFISSGIEKVINVDRKQLKRIVKYAKDLYIQSLNFNHQYLERLFLFCNDCNIDISFAGSIDKIHFDKIVESYPILKDKNIFYASCNLYTAKPELMFYKKIQEFNSQFFPEEILIVDDYLENLITARQIGFLTYFYQSYDMDLKRIKEKVVNILNK